MEYSVQADEWQRQCARMTGAMLTVIGALRDTYADPDGEFEDPELARCVSILWNSLPKSLQS